MRRELAPGWIAAVIVAAVLVVGVVWLQAGRTRPLHTGYKPPAGPKPAQPYIPRATN